MSTGDEDGSRTGYDAIREYSRAKKARNLKESTAILQSLGVPFTSANNGVHLIIRDAGRCFDFWPSTGKWRERVTDLGAGSFLMTNQSKRDGRGVFQLLRELKR